MADNRPIGVFDSGLGGLTVVRELVRLLPYEQIVYFGDTSRVPYGNKSRETIIKYAREDERFLCSRDVKLIVAACGTVSSVAKCTAEALPVPFAEVVSHSVNAAIKATKNGIIGVLGTTATIKSGAHKRYIKEIKPDYTVVENDCPLFVHLVENGLYEKDDPVVYELAKRYLKPLKESGVDTVILGCTHYPVLSDVIGEIMGKDVTLINMGSATAEYVKSYLEENGLCADKQNRENEFYCSDITESFYSVGEILLGERFNTVTRVDIEKE